MAVLSAVPQKAPPTSYFVGVEVTSQASVLRFASLSQISQPFSSVLGEFILGSALSNLGDRNTFAPASLNYGHSARGHHPDLQSDSPQPGLVEIIKTHSLLPGEGGDCPGQQGRLSPLPLAEWAGYPLGGFSPRYYTYPPLLLLPEGMWNPQTPNPKHKDNSLCL